MESNSEASARLSKGKVIALLTLFVSVENDFATPLSFPKVFQRAMLNLSFIASGYRTHQLVNRREYNAKASFLRTEINSIGQPHYMSSLFLHGKDAIHSLIIYIDVRKSRK